MEKKSKVGKNRKVYFCVFSALVAIINGNNKKNYIVTIDVTVKYR